MKSLDGKMFALLALVAAPLAVMATEPAPKKPVVNEKLAPAKPASTMQNMGEAEQLRLQQHQDRRAKAAAVLSNSMKKSADTQTTVTGNLK